MFEQTNLKEFTNSEFQEFCKYIYDSVGIKLTEKKRNLVHNRLRKRLLKFEMTSYGDYFNFVRSRAGKEELVNLINSITTNVTTFFRDPKQFQALSQLVLPHYENTKRKLRIWSSACSTGEEPYTIAIEILKYAKTFNFEIIATDLSTNVLKHAKNGLYGYEQVKTINPHYLKEFFVKKDELYEIKPIIKKYIQFSQLNLIEHTYPDNLDIIFCRNVVIYFDKETKDKIYNKFYQNINKDGFLFVGHAESLFASSQFKFYKPSIYKVVPNT